jgi:hypothetical protein
LKQIKTACESIFPPLCGVCPNIFEIIAKMFGFSFRVRAFSLPTRLQSAAGGQAKA